MSRAISPNKALQKRRMIKYFVEAAESIIEAEGIEGITLRKTAALAGYNSATLYNYFENLDHLLFFVGMKYVDQYHHDLIEHYRNSATELERYCTTWERFIEHSFAHPDMFYRVFFSNLEGEVSHYIQDYYDIFPLTLEDGMENLSIFFECGNLMTREFSVLQDVIQAQNVSEESANDMSAVILLVFEGLLSRVNRKLITPEDGKMLALRYLHQFERFYLSTQSQEER